ncbi:MAG TPA: MFS transporter [Burkholderiales bacterium]|nr:MFS transporter [Burkholderiales bacterium]
MASPFAVRSFRFQWPADLVTSWAFEMEALILGWYILAVTGSVQQLVIVGALVWLGSLFSPFFGVAGDRIGHRTLLCVTRAIYALLAAVLTALTFGGVLEPWHVFVIAGIAGLLRPSDNVMRHVLVGQTMPAPMLLRALGISRTTTDMARVVGALTGAGGVALIGMGPAYAVVTAMYVAAFFLSLGVAGAPAGRPRKAHPIAELKEAFEYVWRKPDLLGAFSLAFLVNLLAYPFVLGLLPYVAKEIFAAGQAGLGYLAAAFWSGALAGSLVVGAARLPLASGRTMLWSGGIWFGAVIVFGLTSSLAAGLALLFATGFVHSFCITPLAAVMLRSSEERMRGRVMGVRMLAIWGLPLGLLLAGPLIAGIGYVATTVLYGGLGLAATIAIGYGWRRALWHRSAAANAAYAG